MSRKNRLVRTLLVCCLSTALGAACQTLDYYDEYHSYQPIELDSHNMYQPIGQYCVAEDSGFEEHEEHHGCEACLRVHGECVLMCYVGDEIVSRDDCPGAQHQSNKAAQVKKLASQAKPQASRPKQQAEKRKPRWQTGR